MGWMSGSRGVKSSVQMLQKGDKGIHESALERALPFIADSLLFTSDSISFLSWMNSSTGGCLPSSLSLILTT